MQIIITDAGKSLESGGRHIVYTIRTGVCITISNMAALALTPSIGSRGSTTIL